MRLRCSGGTIHPGLPRDEQNYIDSIGRLLQAFFVAKILVIDDDGDLRAVMREALESDRSEERRVGKECRL